MKPAIIIILWPETNADTGQAKAQTKPKSQMLSGEGRAYVFLPSDHSKDTQLSVTPCWAFRGSAQGGAMTGWEQLLVLCIHLTLPPFNSSVYPLE